MRIGRDPVCPGETKTTGNPRALLKGQGTKSHSRHSPWALALGTGRGTVTQKGEESYRERLSCVALERGLEGQLPIPCAESLSHVTHTCRLSWGKHAALAWGATLALPCPLLDATALPSSHMAAGSAGSSEPGPASQPFLKNPQEILSRLRECQRHVRKDRVLALE